MIIINLASDYIPFTIVLSCLLTANFEAVKHAQGRVSAKLIPHMTSQKEKPQNLIVGRSSSFLSMTKATQKMI